MEKSILESKEKNMKKYKCNKILIDMDVLNNFLIEKTDYSISDLLSETALTGLIDIIPAEEKSTADTREQKSLLPAINNIFYNKEKGILNVMWSDGSTTRVVTAPEDKFTLTAGIKEAVLKKACGNKFTDVENFIKAAKSIAVSTSKKSANTKKDKLVQSIKAIANEVTNLSDEEKAEIASTIASSFKWHSKDTNVKVSGFTVALKDSEKVYAKKPRRKVDAENKEEN